MSTRTDADLVRAVRAGESEAFGELADRWFDRCYDVARNVVRSPEAAADITQDALISAWQRLDRLDDVEAFGGWLLRITRNRGLDWLRVESRSRPFGAVEMTEIHDGGAAAPGEGRQREATHDPEAATVDAERDEVLDAAAVALGEADASLLGLHLRHGLTPAEIADEMGVTANVAHQRLFRMRNRLGDAIGALLLWHRGRPSCPALLALVQSAAEFDANVFGTVERHRRKCEECQDERAALVAPHQLLAALPIATIPLLLRARIVDGLAAAGVPTEAITITGAPTGTGTGAELDPVGSDGLGPVGQSAGPVGSDGLGLDGQSAGLVGSDGLGADGQSAGLAAEPTASSSTVRNRRIAAGVVVVMFLFGVGALLTTASTGGGSAGPVPATAVAGGASSLPAAGVDGFGGDLESTETLSVTAPSDPPSAEARSGPSRSGGVKKAKGKSPDSGSGETIPAQTDASPAVQQPPAPPPAAPPETDAPAPLAPPPPSPTAPPDSTSPPPAPTTAPQSTLATTTTAVPAPAPTITSFAVSSGSHACSSPSQTPRVFTWTTSDATTVVLTVGGTSEKVATSGSSRACAAQGVVATLTAGNAVGQVSSQIRLP